MTRQEVLAQIYALMAEAEGKIAEAEALADEHGVGFYWDGPSYGMGGSYGPAREEDAWGGEGPGWLASSQSGC